MLRATSVFLVALATVATVVSGCGSGDGQIRLDRVRLDDTGSELHAVLTMHNGTAYPAYVYASPRRLLWDDATKTLTLEMRESACTDTSSTICMHYMFPSYVEIDSFDDKDVVVKLPRELTKLGSAAPGGGVTFEKEPIASAARAVAHVAYADAPVESTPRDVDPRATVIAAEREVLVGEWRR